MAIAITTPAIQPRKLAPIPGGAPVGGSDRVRAMAPDSLKLGMPNDKVARSYLKLGRDAATGNRWGDVASPFRKAVANSATQGVALEVFEAAAAVLGKASRDIGGFSSKTYQNRPESCAQLIAVKADLLTIQASAAQKACSLATTLDQALILVERANRLGPRSTETALNSVIEHGKTVDELLEVANKASKLGFAEIAESAMDKALGLTGNSSEAALRIATLAHDLGNSRVAERATDKASGAGN